jgi:hypothetical protein
MCKDGRCDGQNGGTFEQEYRPNGKAFLRYSYECRAPPGLISSLEGNWKQASYSFPNSY